MKRKLALPAYWHWASGILLLAILLRGVGIGFGLPFWLANDELAMIGGAMRMLELRNPIPGMNQAQMTILYYPVGIPWLYLIAWTPILFIKWVLAGFEPLHLFGERIVSDFSVLWLTARSISVAASAATAVVVMRLSGDIFRTRWAAVIAGLLMATSFHHAMLGHFARVWPLQLFFWWFGMLCAWLIYSDGHRRHYVWAGIAAGAGFMINYVGVLVSVAVLIAHLARHRRIVIDRSILKHAAIVAAFIFVTLITSWSNFLRAMGFSSLFVGVLGEIEYRTQPGVSGLPDVAGLIGFYARAIVKGDPLLAAIGLAAIPLLCRRAPVFILMFVVSMMPFAVLLVTGYADDDRYILPFTPIFAVAAGGFASLSHGGLRKAVMALVVVVVGVQTAALVQLDRLMLRPDTREQARTWIIERISGQEGVISRMRSVAFEQTRRSIELERDLGPNALSYLQRRRLAGADISTAGGGPAHDAVHLRQIGTDAIQAAGPDQLLDRLLRDGYSWYVTDDLTGPIHGGFEALLQERLQLVYTIEPGGPGVRPPIFNLTNQFERGSFFDIFRVQSLGPRVDIYRLR